MALTHERLGTAAAEHVVEPCGSSVAAAAAAARTSLDTTVAAFTTVANSPADTHEAITTVSTRQAGNTLDLDSSGASDGARAAGSKSRNQQRLERSEPEKLRWWRRRWLLTVFAWSAAIANGLIAVTGATVRVTGSGLGCATWPECQPGSLIPESRTGLEAVHQAIEFSNRTLTGVVLIASLGTFVLALLARPRRRPVVWLAAAGPVGVLMQAVWGGIVVLTGLSWWTVAPHLLLSLVLLFFAIAVVVRLGEPDGPVRPVVPSALRWLAAGIVGVLALLCIAGTLVTAAGPHGGDKDTERLDVSLPLLAHVHADLMFTYFGLGAAMFVGFLAVRAPRRLLRRTGMLVLVTAAQGTIGLVQYVLAVPEALVVAHVFGAVVIVTAAALVWFATREREPVPVGSDGVAGSVTGLELPVGTTRRLRA